MDNSLESLLEWLKAPDRLLDWDAIVAISSKTVNDLLHQAYISHLQLGTGPDPFEGSVPIGTTHQSHYFGNLRFSAPRFTFSRASLVNARLDVHFDVLEGTQALIREEFDQLQVISLSSYSPQPRPGPYLSFRLSLESDGQTVALDLAQSEEAEFHFDGTPTEQSLVGEALEAWFRALPASARTFKIGEFKGEQHPLLSTRRIDIRSQLNDETGDGALLLFPTLNHGLAGNFPSSDADFRFLVPDGYSGTALVSLGLAHRGVMGNALIGWLGADAFVYEPNVDGALGQMIATRGELTVRPANGEDPTYEYQSEAFVLSAASGAMPLRLDFQDDQVIQQWGTSCTVSMKYRRLGGGTAWTEITPTFQINYKHEFHVSLDDDGHIEGQLFPPHNHGSPIRRPHTLGKKRASLPAGATKFIENLVNNAFLMHLSEHLVSTASNALVNSFELANDYVLKPVVSALPNDMATIGQLGPKQSSFQIVEQALVLVPGQVQRLTTEPAREGLEWTLELITGTSPGRFVSPGEYQAPPRSTVVGNYSHVLVTATDLQTREYSRCLVSITAVPLSLSPLVRVCLPEQTLLMQARSFDGQPVSWRLLGNGSGDVTDEGYRYTAPAQGGQATYALERVEASAGGHTETIAVLVQHYPADLKVIVDDQSNLGPGKVQLRAFYRNSVKENATWRVLAGGGTINEQTGVFEVLANETERFAVITAHVLDGANEYDGHIILPLPLDQFPVLKQRLAVLGTAEHLEVDDHLDTVGQLDTVMELDSVEQLDVVEQAPQGGRHHE